MAVALSQPSPFSFCSARQQDPAQILQRQHMLVCRPKSALRQLVSAFLSAHKCSTHTETPVICNATHMPTCTRAADLEIDGPARNIKAAAFSWWVHELCDVCAHWSFFGRYQCQDGMRGSMLPEPASVKQTSQTLFVSLTDSVCNVRNGRTGCVREHLHCHIIAGR